MLSACPVTPARAATSSKVPSPLLRYRRLGRRFAADEQVEEAIVVVSRPSEAEIELTGSSRPAFLVTSVKVPLPLLRSKLGRIGYGSQAPRDDEDVQEAVVVVIGLDEVEAAVLVGSARPPRCDPRMCHLPCCGKMPWAGRGRTS